MKLFQTVVSFPANFASKLATEVVDEAAKRLSIPAVPHALARIAVQMAARSIASTVVIAPVVLVLPVPLRTKKTITFALSSAIAYASAPWMVLEAQENVAMLLP